MFTRVVYKPKISTSQRRSFSLLPTLVSRFCWHSGKDANGGRLKGIVAYFTGNWLRVDTNGGQILCGEPSFHFHLQFLCEDDTAMVRVSKKRLDIAAHRADIFLPSL
jgi:hypothetical protein